MPAAEPREEGLRRPAFENEKTAREVQLATLNILEDFNAEKARLEQTQRAVLNILDDFNIEKTDIEDTQKATLNILDDFNVEKTRLEDIQRAVLNILDDFNAEKASLEGTQKATLNILEDFNAEKARLEETQRAVLNILDDFNAENAKVERSNRLLEVKTAELQEARDVLEVRVRERTSDLERSNVQLRSEMEERTRAEELVKASLREKETLLKEIHHRVKNNLQIIYSMLNLQLPQVKDPQAVSLYKESQNRVYTMALIHEKLYQSESMSSVDLPEYLRSLTANLFSSYAVGGNVRSRIDVEKVTLDIDSLIPCALIVNELVSNSLKHAFPPARLAEGPGEVRVSMHRLSGKRLILSVADDGIGMPAGFDVQNSRSLGLKLVTLLAGQLKGTISLDNSAGTEFTISFEGGNEG